MNVAPIAWRNVWRRKRRSVLSMLAVGIACALLVVMMAIQQGSYADLINNSVHAHTGHVQIQHPDYLEDRDLASSVESPESVMAKLEGLPRAREVAPRINAPVLVSHGQRTFGALLFGIDPIREASVSTMPTALREGEWLATDDVEGALLGSMLARNLQVGVGDEVIFLGQGRDGSTAAARLIVRGLFMFGIDDLDRSTFVANLHAVQDAFSMQGAVSEIAVLLEDDKFRERASEQITQRLAGEKDLRVLGWPDIMPGTAELIRIDWYSGLIMYGILVLVVGFGIANTFLMAFMERIHEYGVLLSLGMRPRTLGWMAYLESLILTGLGLVLGLAIGLGVTKWLTVHGINFFEPGDYASHYGVSDVLYPKLTPMVLVLAIAIVLAISALMAVYPAVKAGRLKPVEALRHA